MINPQMLPEKVQTLQKRMYPDSLRPSGYISCKPEGTVSGAYKPAYSAGLYAPSLASKMVEGSKTSTECHAPAGI